jgi:hypothetical protein
MRQKTNSRRIEQSGGGGGERGKRAVNTSQLITLYTAGVKVL